MNILFTRFPLESSYGGAEVQTVSLMKGLQERGHHVEFLGSCPTLLEKAMSHGLRAMRLDIGPPPVTKWGAVSFLWRKKRIEQTLISFLRSSDMCHPERSRRTTIAAIFMLSIAEKLLLTPWALEHGIQVFWIEHDRIGRWLTWNPWLARLRKLSKKVTTIVVSDLSKKMYRELGWDADKVISIANGVAILSPFQRERARERVVNDSFHKPSPQPSPLKGRGEILHLGCVARLTQDKGVDLLIDAVSDIPETELTILGRGPEEGYLRKIIEERNLIERVHLKNWVDDIHDFYSSIDILILPSREHDPFGLAAAEAMMVGIPVIVTDACGIAGYLCDGVDAIIIQANSSEALKEGIKRMSNREYRIQIASEGQKTAKEKFSLETMIDRYEEVLSSPLPKKVPPHF